MFGLQTKAGSQLRRHRYFEMPWFNGLIIPCSHNKYSAIGVYGGGQNPDRKRIPVTIGVWGHAGGTSKRDGLIQFGTKDRRDAMGIDWMTGNELSEAIPPVYTEYIGKYLMQAVLERKQ
jgi:DNA (cytosine-5)-methyltransferase 1